MPLFFMMINPLSKIIDLFFPRTCMACGNILMDNNQIICHTCLTGLPYTYFHADNKNLMYKRLSTFIPITSAFSLLYFQKKSIVQEILHQLKYKNHQEIGEFFGKIMANHIKNTMGYIKYDYIIPVPLHPKKMKTRGYNQLSYLCKTLAEELGSICDENLLLKIINNESQTHKNSEERKRNVKDIFQLHGNTKKYENKHLLLIDDVMTTGATLESAAKELLKINNIKLSIATLAMVQ